MLDHLYRAAESSLEQLRELSQEVKNLPPAEIPSRADLATRLIELLTAPDPLEGQMRYAVPGQSIVAALVNEAHALLCDNGHQAILHPTRDEADESGVPDAPEPGRPELPSPPSTLDHLPQYLQQVRRWIVDELEDLFETVPPALLDELPRAGDKYVFAEWMQLKIVVRRITRLDNCRTPWKEFQTSYKNVWNEDKTSVARLTFLRRVCQQYAEILAPPEFEPDPATVTFMN
jgi:hypothetical protein